MPLVLVLETTSEEWRKVLDVQSARGSHPPSCRLFGKQMADRGQGGHIVNTASAAAFQPSRALPAYSTSKAAVLMLSECLRAELAGKSIGVSAICPGIVNTNITATTRFAGADAAEEERLQKRTPGSTDGATTPRRRSPTPSCGRSCATRPWSR
ncbi:putative oxidoreductase EphD [Streptomyces badius]